LGASPRVPTAAPPPFAVAFARRGTPRRGGMNRVGPARRRAATGRRSRPRPEAERCRARRAAAVPSDVPDTGSPAVGSGGGLDLGTPLFERVTDLLAEMLVRDLHIRPATAARRGRAGALDFPA
jgi:hypothetical protein